jgi:hypothetical protein
MKPKYLTEADEWYFQMSSGEFSLWVCSSPKYHNWYVLQHLPERTELQGCCPLTLSNFKFQLN